ncbi:MAG: hypothetical protein AB7F89_09960 [Pirellulaceae bacterium]
MVTYMIGATELVESRARTQRNACQEARRVVLPKMDIPIMHDTWPARPEGSRADFLKHIAQLDDPAFVRRARQVTDAWNRMTAACRRQRDELLEMTRLRLAIVAELVERDWTRVASHLRDPLLADTLADWYRAWKPQLRGTVPATQSGRRIRAALRELAESVERFNVKWRDVVQSQDLTTINRLRHDYNRYYVVEKACALQSESLAAAGFEPLPPVTVEQLFEIFPLLDVPSVAS